MSPIRQHQRERLRSDLQHAFACAFADKDHPQRVLVLVRATRAALVAYEAELEKSLARTREILAQAEAWAESGEVPREFLEFRAALANESETGERWFYATSAVEDAALSVMDWVTKPADPCWNAAAIAFLDYMGMGFASPLSECNALPAIIAAVDGAK